MMKKITLLAMFVFASLQFSSAQTYFSDDFSSGDLSNWVLTDSDGDNNNWYVADLDDGVQEEHATSASWNQGTILFPDNWMVSTAIDLSGASGNVFLEWKAYGQDQSWAQENYSVYVATASDIATLGASSTTFTEIIGTSTGYVERNLDVSAFVGQTIYVAFRHHNVSDMFRLNIDDVAVRTFNNDDVALANINLPNYGIVNTDYNLGMVITNVGGNAITSIEASWTDGSTTNTATIATNIAGGATATIAHPDVLNYSGVVGNTIEVSITGVNGGADNNPADNSFSVPFNTMTQSGTKAVLIEESTGTWCGWCPRGTVGLDYMASTYPNSVVAIAVHNGDPMTVSEYDTALVNVIGTGWPNSGVDRKLTGVDPGQASLQNAYDNQITEVVPLDLAISASQSGNNLTISATASFFTNFSNANLRLAAIITEDGVTGTSNNYAQANYYSGGASGPMGGYESLPDPIPASQMVYDHVGRALLGGFNGAAGSIPAAITAGDNVTYDFSYTIPSNSDQDNMNVVVLVLNQVDGSVVSGVQTSVSQALSVEDVSGIDSIKIFPNPAKDNINIALNASNGDYSISVTDMLGRTVLEQSYEGLFGNQTLQLPVSELNPGHYVMLINDGNASYSSKFIVSQ